MIPAALAVAACAHAQTKPDNDSRNRYPKFSWDTVPVYCMFGETVTLSDEQIKSIAKRCNGGAVPRVFASSSSGPIIS